jgi:DNA (cytosine-5)-methyltransferase 1
MAASRITKSTFLDFFSGSGLVCEGLKRYFIPIWANDICEKKAAVFCANHCKRRLKSETPAGVKKAV